MSQVIKAFFGVFFVLFMSVVSAGILSAFMVVVDAQDIHASMIDEIEDSNFYPGILQDCFAEAEQAGYQIEITLYQEDYSQIVCSSADMIPADTSQVTSARVDMTFPFSVGFFGIWQQHTLSAYAR
jgi:hypothetical protein